MTAQNVPDWLSDGRTVVVTYGGAGITTTTRVERSTRTQVVLGNGARVRLRAVTGDHGPLIGTPEWVTALAVDPASELGAWLLAGDEYVAPGDVTVDPDTGLPRLRGAP